MPDHDWRHLSSPRRGNGPWLVGLGLIGLIGVMALEAHWIWRIILGLPLAWAVVELVLNTPAELQLTDSELVWRRGDKEGWVYLDRIEMVVIHRRLDLSTTITIRQANGAKRRLPPDHRPPIAEFAEALQARGVRTDIRQFTQF